jgi:hypothetical protein
MISHRAVAQRTVRQPTVQGIRLAAAADPPVLLLRAGELERDSGASGRRDEPAEIMTMVNHETPWCFM